MCVPLYLGRGRGKECCGGRLDSRRREGIMERGKDKVGERKSTKRREIKLEKRTNKREKGRRERERDGEWREEGTGLGGKRKRKGGKGS